MADISICIEPFFPELTFEEKLKKISDLGFKSYEFWFHNKTFANNCLIDEMKDFDRIADLNVKYGLMTNDFVLNHSDGGIEASLMCLEDRQKILDQLDAMIVLAKKIGCTRFISGSGNTIPGLPVDEACDIMVESLSQIGTICENNSMEILLEPFNTLVDHPKTFLSNPEMTVDILKRAGKENVKFLFDIYHMQIMHGNILDFIKDNLSYIRHFHIAGVPGRKEPIDTELNYPYIIRQIEAMGYTGSFGLEYWPSGNSEESLRNTLEHLNG
ncbi:MAG: TIM barrel protein [Candidatus Brocadiales bacterium]|nr:TIM barrel protein [Candidatus Brocadiales bacterium]